VVGEPLTKCRLFPPNENVRFTISSSRKIPRLIPRAAHLVRRKSLPQKNRLDRAGLRAGTDKRFIRALAEEQLERTDDDRFAGPGLAGDGR
jgi:hypothetical protein